MKFKVNSNTWLIKELPKEKMSVNGAIGETDYELQEIHLLDKCKSKRNTLKHELCHVWLWEYSHVQNDDDKFHYKQVCQIVANSNDFINSIVDKYFK